VSGKHTLHDDEAANELAPFVDCLPKFFPIKNPKFICEHVSHMMKLEMELLSHA